MVALSVAVAAVSLPLASFDAEAKRLGGGRSSGMQRQAPAQSPQSTPGTPAQQPGNAAPVAGAAAPAAAGAAAAAGKRSWMGPIAGLAAGLGIAALFSHLGMGAGLANFMTMLLLAIVAFVAIRFLMRRFAGNRQGQNNGLQMAGAGAGAGGNANGGAFNFNRTLEPQQPLQRQSFDAAPAAAATGLGAVPAAAATGRATLPADFDSEGFQRIAKMLFIRMQAANDAGQVDDLRKFTTPELFASLRLDLQDRGAKAQQTDVVQLDADLADYAEEQGQQIVTVRFHGLIREEIGAGAEPFNELWHFVKPVAGGDWAIAGIQPL
ncbi:Tim44 domain-containing protein [Aquincola sp. J276]|uniref:Tim44 domain-containing protein n=1 Tax=Aquincola sp. J276 TaxID=2898432 RepID=UPI002151E4FE|nr:Tim44-like domain-containing protein [Aquincola sp. J276]MCR5865390.1 39S ribosomal protein L45 [Aquincola sp. J276]